MMYSPCTPISIACPWPGFNNTGTILLCEEANKNMQEKYFLPIHIPVIEFKVYWVNIIPNPTFLSKLWNYYEYEL